MEKLITCECGAVILGGRETGRCRFCGVAYRRPMVLAQLSTNKFSPALAGVIQAIRVQDIQRHVWYSWDKPGPWSPSGPNVTVGSQTLYIAFWAVNTGTETGAFTLDIKDDAGKTLATKTVDIAPGQGAGIEAPNLDMPDRTYKITLTVSPGEETKFSIEPRKPIPITYIALGAVGIALAAAGVALLMRKK